MSMVNAPRPGRAPRRGPAPESLPERHLRVVAEPRHRSGRWLWGFIAVSVVGLMLFAAVAFNVSLITDQQRITDLEGQAQEAQRTYDRLRVEVDELSAPRRIAARARSLGMVEAGERTWLAPSEGSTVVDTGQETLAMRDYLDIKPYLGDNP